MVLVMMKMYHLTMLVVLITYKMMCLGMLISSKHSTLDPVYVIAKSMFQLSLWRKWRKICVMY
ncbi:ORF966 [White spot syndrome virus]|uniref:ORF966 n=1 Tax=White spot syndrome virus TaxID=342409 RepID=A0A2D3I708_9VIRU|nr:ORF966 [White spot syndrome virus]